VIGVAQVLATAGRFEDSAEVYEIAGFFELAGKARASANPALALQYLSGLIRQFQSSGVVTVIRCPSCGAGIRVAQDTPESRLQTCPYCGNAFKVNDVADFLKTVLGTSP
jgi:hypothetical protein